jgi:hypothetical protein
MMREAGGVAVLKFLPPPVTQFTMPQRQLGDPSQLSLLLVAGGLSVGLLLSECGEWAGLAVRRGKCVGSVEAILGKFTPRDGAAVFCGRRGGGEDCWWVR